MKVRRRAVVDRDPGDIWAVLATGVPVVTRLWRRGRLTARTGELPEPGAVMEIIATVGGDEPGGMARITAYRPPRHLRWTVANVAGPFGHVSGTYRVWGDGPSAVDLELSARRGSLLGLVVAPVAWLVLGRLADDLLQHLVTAIESRPALAPLPPDWAAIPVEADRHSEDAVQERLSQGRIYAFRISRDVLSALQQGSRAAALERSNLSTPTLGDLAQAMESLSNEHDSLLISVSAREARELREHLSALVDTSKETDADAMAGRAQTALAALDAVLATDYLTAR